MFERLAKLDPYLTPERILVAIDRPSIDQVTQSDLTDLIGRGTAIKQGEISIEEAFPEDKAAAEDSTKKTDAKNMKDGIGKSSKGTVAKSTGSEDSEQESLLETPKSGKLDKEQIELLRKKATDKGLAWSALEEEYGGPVAEWTLEGATATELFTDASGLIDKLAAKQ